MPRRRPLYNHALKDQVICFTGFTDRSQVSQLAALVHYMDGTIRKEYNTNVTHVVANHCKGEKYKVCISCYQLFVRSVRLFPFVGEVFTCGGTGFTCRALDLPVGHWIYL